MTDSLSIKKEKLHAQTYGILRKALMTGRFQPGQKLLLRPLAEKLGISVTPVREALLQLVTERALTSDSSRSLSVPILDLARFREIRDLRIELEGRAAEVAAKRATTAHVAKLERLQEELRACRRAGDFAGALVTNEAFHFTVYGLAEMPVLYSIIEGLWVQIGPILTRLFDRVDTKSLDNHPHDEMITAFRRNDGAAARHALAGDILWAAGHLEASLAAGTHATPNPPEPPPPRKRAIH